MIESTTEYGYLNDEQRNFLKEAVVFYAWEQLVEKCDFKKDARVEALFLSALSQKESWEIIFTQAKALLRYPLERHSRWAVESIKVGSAWLTGLQEFEGIKEIECLLEEVSSKALIDFSLFQSWMARMRVAEINKDFAGSPFARGPASIDDKM